MRSVVVFFSVLIFSCNKVLAQENNIIRRNAFSFEIGKTGLLYNISFDHQLKNTKAGYRFFAGSNFAKYLNGFSTGMGAFYLAGKKKSFLELGIDACFLKVEEISGDQRGFSFIFPDYSIKTFYTSFNTGLRLYGKKSLFRIGISPGIIKDGFLLGGYVSFGFRF